MLAGKGIRELNNIQGFSPVRSSMFAGFTSTILKL
jgi:hypothetical protein